MNESRKQKSSKAIFLAQKSAALSGVDLSRKGNIDSQILSLVAFINKQAAFFTTSSCSGRILVFIQTVEESGKIQKRNCEWLVTTHDRITDVDSFVDEAVEKVARFRDQLKGKVSEACLRGGETKIPIPTTNNSNQQHQPITTSVKKTGVAFLKFEPMVLHVQCADLESARRLHLAAVESGFKNSGLSVGKKKIISAVRSCHSLDVPISDETGNLIVTRDYLKFVTQLADGKLETNFQSIERLRLTVIKALSGEEADGEDICAD